MRAVMLGRYVTFMIYVTASSTEIPSFIDVLLVVICSVGPANMGGAFDRGSVAV